MSSASEVTRAPRAPEVLLEAAERQLRSERFVKQVTYMGLGIPLGALYVALVIVAFQIGILGLPLLLVASGVLWRCALVERRLANRLLDAGISPLPPLFADTEAGFWARVRERLSSRPFWRAVALLLLKLPATLLAATPTLVGVAAVISLFIYGIRGLAESGVGYVGPVSLGPGLGVALLLLTIPVTVLTVAVTDTMARGLRALARALLVTSLPAGAPVRETLARSLGDRTLSIAYWLPEREQFVDERGYPVPLPTAGSDRAWTAVDYDGRRVAAIIHDASLEATPELVEAAAAAASLALDNERLKAELRARVEELRASRVRIVEASNSARRRLERDLHDGAQQQLVAMAVELRLLRSRVGANPEAEELIGSIETKLTAALEELRDLAQGIHPGILTDRGLAPALESLAGRAPLDMRCEIDLPSRPPSSVEAVAYFVIAEALTNVLKYAKAESATIRARYEGDELVVEMQDNGVGGADETRGSGLQGLRDRVGALDGSITVISPAGEGTLVQARIPVKPPR
ncbi:MAG TPA: sensor domain-containing protein [Solirubrobacteraceae bacterium]|nr:sensor domain-containing protein [Solirubrobacteraceae bacterium]